MHNRLDIILHFSIIVPLYEAYKFYYDELLDSIISQSNPYFECLLVYYGDLPTFNRSLDKRFRLIKSESDTVTAKRNIGIKEARYDYIVFCDADDCIGHNLLLTFSKILSDRDYDLICFLHTINTDSLDTSLNVPNIYLFDKQIINDYIFGKYLKNPPVNSNYIFDSSWSKCFKKRILLKYNILFIDPPCAAEDMLFVNKYCVHIKSMALIPYKGYYWRQNGISVTHSPTSFSFEIEPLCIELKRAIYNIEGKYSDYIDTYLGKRILLQAHLIFKCFYQKQIDRAEAYKCIDKTIPVGGESNKCLTLMDTNDLPITQKIYRKMLISRRFRTLFLVEFFRYIFRR